MKNEEIFKTMDSNIKRNQEELIKYTRTRRGKSGHRYEYYTQFIFEEYKTRSAESIREEIEAAGIKSVSSQQIWNIKYKIENHNENKRPLAKGDKKCWTDWCKNKIADGNHAYCKACVIRHNNIDVDESFTVENNCAY